MDGLAKVKQSLVSESNVTQLDTDKCKYMLFLIGIIERDSGQLCTVKSNILSENREFERRTNSESTCKSLYPLCYNRAP